MYTTDKVVVTQIFHFVFIVDLFYFYHSVAALVYTIVEITGGAAGSMIAYR